MKGIISFILVIMAGCTTTKISGFCEVYEPVYNYVDTNLDDEQKDNIRYNNGMYDLECLKINYTDN